VSKILVVDDSAAVRNDVSEFLKSHGIAVEIAVDGLDAFEKLSANVSDFKVAIVDINMPNMDGLTFIEKVNAELEGAQVNFIMLTSEFEGSLKARGKAAGVKGWIVKPFNGSKAIGAIKKMLG
jgi:two-component system chemotaxis response regulator CheY